MESLRHPVLPATPSRATRNCRVRPISSIPAEGLDPSTSPVALRGVIGFVACASPESSARAVDLRLGSSASLAFASFIVGARLRRHPWRMHASAAVLAHRGSATRHNHPLTDRHHLRASGKSCQCALRAAQGGVVAIKHSPRQIPHRLRPPALGRAPVAHVANMTPGRARLPSLARNSLRPSSNFRSTTPIAPRALNANREGSPSSLSRPIESTDAARSGHVTPVWRPTRQFNLSRYGHRMNRILRS